MSSSEGFADGIWGRSPDHSLTLTALRRALAKHAAPEVHHSDQGIQYAATAYTHVLQDTEVQISMADKGEAWQNGYAECLIRTIKEEEVDLSEYLGYHDAYQQIGRFLDDVYVHKRINSSLGYLTPAELEAQWREEHTLVLDLELTPVRKVSSFWGSLQASTVWYVLDTAQARLARKVGKHYNLLLYAGKCRNRQTSVT